MKQFFDDVANLRSNILNNYWTSANQNLDKLVRNVMERWHKMTQGELTLEEDVTRVIKRIKEAKENEALKKKAEEVISKLKAEL